MVNKAFIEIMIEGDANGRGFQYPIPTYSITKDFDWSETENNKLLFEMTAKYGTPYFSNYINSDMEPSDVRSMCCRLRLDLRELRKKSGGFFGSGESTGSVGVVTINLPRIAYLAKTEEEFYKRLDDVMDISARSLHIKREVITSLLENGLYSDARVLTLRELFIVSSLPEEWDIPDWASDTFMRQIIGEAIPPLLAYNIVKLMGSDEVDNIKQN